MCDSFYCMVISPECLGKKMFSITCCSHSPAHKLNSFISIFIIYLCYTLFNHFYRVTVVISVKCIYNFFFFIYKRMALKVFGGFTGDLAGWFLTVCELVILAAVILTEKVVTLWF